MCNSVKLKDVEPWVWVRLAECPDRLDKAGPTDFEVSHSPTGEVFTRDKKGCPSFCVSGEQRKLEWLNTSVLN